MKTYLLLGMLFCIATHPLFGVIKGKMPGITNNKIITNNTPLPLTFRISSYGSSPVNLLVEKNSTRSTTEVAAFTSEIDGITIFFPNASSADLDVHNRCIIIKKDVMGTDPGVFQHFAEYFQDKECKKPIEPVKGGGYPIGYPMVNPVK